MTVKWEDFLAGVVPGFERGTPYYSLDGGKTWQPGEPPLLADESEHFLRVEKVDRDAGTVTLRTGWRKPR